MEIIIKAFNRPYCLDRCLHSLYQYCDGQNHDIKILDDGTPQNYLDKLKVKYDSIEIFKSPNYKIKAEACKKNEEPSNKEVPIQFWLEHIDLTTDVFLLLEEDMWFTSYVDLEAIEENFKQYNISFLKLFWLGNKQMIQANNKKELGQFYLFDPVFFTQQSWLFYLIFKINRYGARKISTFLGLFSNKRFLAYYAIYSVAGAVFSKDYYLNLWSINQKHINEERQLLRALERYKATKGTHTFAHTNKEMIMTTFLSASTNPNNGNYESVNMFLLNGILNQAWYKGDFVSTEDLQDDFDVRKLKRVINTSAISFSIENWEKWSHQFKDAFRKIGCVIR